MANSNRRTVVVTLGHETLRVRINGLLHLNILHEKIVGFQSWEKGRPAHGWFIEFHTTGGAILAEYADGWNWNGYGLGGIIFIYMVGYLITLVLTVFVLYPILLDLGELIGG